MTPRTKTVEVGERKFELRRLAPEVGSFILMRMMGVSMQMAGERPAQTAKPPSEAEAVEAVIKKMSAEDRVRALAFAVFANGMKFEDFKFVQASCVRCAALVVERAGQPFPMPLMTDAGEWTPDAEELSAEPGTVNNVVMEVLIFSLASFFEEGVKSS